jgi:hypothetical protein
MREREAPKKAYPAHDYELVDSLPELGNKCFDSFKYAA